MRVGFFGQSGILAPLVLRQLLAAQDAYEIVLVVDGKKTPMYGQEHRLFEPAPRAIPKIKESDLCTVATASGVPVLATSNVNSHDAVCIMQRYEFDYIVCAGFDRLFGPGVLSTARSGTVNVHASRLPQWRGPSPLFWLVKSGVREGTVTLHAIDEKEDHGVIYAQELFTLPRRASAEQLLAIAGEVAARMLVPVLGKAARGELTGMPQERADTPRARRPTSEDAFVEPLEWGCEHLVDFACVAPGFCMPSLRVGANTVFVRRGLLAEPGKSMPTEYFRDGRALIVQCRDGLAHLEISLQAPAPVAPMAVTKST